MWRNAVVEHLEWEAGGRDQFAVAVAHHDPAGGER
jgi:hypothetical protein